MGTWDLFIAEVCADPPEPEDVRELRKLLGQGDELAHIFLEWEDRQKPPRYEVVLSRPALGAYSFHHTVQHSDAFMRWSLETRAKLLDHQAEALRTLFLLQTQLRSLEEDLGSSYFNSVLVEYLRIHGPPQTLSLLSGFEQRLAPHSTRKMQAQEALDEIVRTIAKMLQGFGYPHQQVGAVLDRALAQYCDERFGLMRRRSLLDQ